jgi:hypothetical protein
MPTLTPHRLHAPTHAKRLKAQQLITEHPTWTNTRIAAEVGVAVATI